MITYLSHFLYANMAISKKNFIQNNPKNNQTVVTCFIINLRFFLDFYVKTRNGNTFYALHSFYYIEIGLRSLASMSSLTWQ